MVDIPMYMICLLVIQLWLWIAPPWYITEHYSNKVLIDNWNNTSLKLYNVPCNDGIQFDYTSIKGSHSVLRAHVKINVVTEIYLP